MKLAPKEKLDIPVTIFNVNRLNYPIKRQRLSGWIKIQKSLHVTNK